MNRQFMVKDVCFILKYNCMNICLQHNCTKIKKTKRFLKYFREKGELFLRNGKYPEKSGAKLLKTEKHSNAGAAGYPFRLATV